MENRIDSSRLKSRALDLGFQSVGICDAIDPVHLDAYKGWLERGHHATMSYLAEHLPLKERPQTLLPGAKSIVAVALNYNQPNPPRPGFPRIARYALGRDYHRVLRSKLKRLALWLETEVPGSQSRACVDSAPILEREYANLAGLGFFGKNTMLIDPKRGSWFFIGLLLTTCLLEADSPHIGSCGSCTKCIQACPTGALVCVEGTWQVDSRRCISYLTIEHRGEIAPEFHSRISDWTFGCDVCQETCPFNEVRETQPLRAEATSETDFLQSKRWPALNSLATITDPEWDTVTRGSPVRRAGRLGLQRNAAINLNNSLSLQKSIEGHP